MGVAMTQGNRRRVGRGCARCRTRFGQVEEPCIFARNDIQQRPEALLGLVQVLLTHGAAARSRNPHTISTVIRLFARP